MKKWLSKNNCNIYQLLSGRSNVYLIESGVDFILVDTGKQSAFKRLQKNLNRLKISLEDITYLILTHTHYDHCQTAKRIKEISGCKIITSRESEESVKSGYYQLPNGTLFFTRIIARLGQNIGIKKYGYEPFEPDILIDNEYQIYNNIRITETAGHSKDSISIIVDEEIAIVGDAMFGVFSNSAFPPYADDVSKMVEKWGKLLKTNCSIFLPGHGSEVKRKLLQREFEKYSSQ
ncbi:MAG: MBL fold metallo-hydrolase [Prolixibacteraceae bacterium]|nr:MBL fold metallo-hydrolase [Prolixibacteraceae bacterium]